MRRIPALVVTLALVLGVTATATADSAPPMAAETALTNVASVAAGYYNGCAVLTSGQVRCWGGNTNGAIGNNSLADQFNRAQTVLDPSGTGPLQDVSEVTVGNFHACALLTSGQVRCWGDNGFGQLGNNDLPTDSRLPVPVRNVDDTGPLEDVRAVSADANGTCALLDNGEVRCWGEDNYGQLGDGGGSTTAALPVVVKGVDTEVLTGVASLSSGNHSRCVALENGQARCWGFNTFRALGDGTTETRFRPVVVRGVGGNGALTGVTQISITIGHSCARLATGRLVCWGSNGNGQVGDGTRTDRVFPVAVKRNGVRLSGVRQVEVGDVHTCALLTNGRVLCWGDDRFGQGGDGRRGVPASRRVPTAVRNSSDTGPLQGITQFDGGNLHNCARTTGGQARCWGYGEFGGLGDGDTDDDVLPRAVLL